MTAPASAEVDPARVAADLRHWFPGTLAWRGHATGTWWAMTRDRAGECHLVEAATPAGLVRRLDRLAVPRARLTARTDAGPDVTVMDLPPVPPVTAPAARDSGERQHRAPRRGRLRAR
ncbi:hypothetical protein [Actinomadura sediminis]|uniref:Aminoglycoside phosphotransferase family protein n=1 Tax=Actinomadura sediminis TaxID=1038904 RepID=A0ABW3ER18_9ACTN